MTQAPMSAGSAGRTASLDHVGIVGPDLPALATTFAGLGFLLTPLARHPGGRTGNRCIMLQDSYLELVSTIDNGTSATLERFLARHAGIHILALGMTDEAAAVDRLSRAGIAASVDLNERTTDEADPVAPMARFALVTPPDQPEGRIHLIRHLTPDAMWQPRHLDHPNRAAALREVTLAVAHPVETAARFSRLAGAPVSPDRTGGFTLPLRTGQLRFVDAAAMQALFPGTHPPALPWIGGLRLTTADGNRSIRRLLADSKRLHSEVGQSILVEAGGVWIAFDPA